MNDMRPSSLAVWAIIAGTLVILPAGPTSAQVGQFDGPWRVRHSSATCHVKSGSYRMIIANGKIRGRTSSGAISGEVFPSGLVRWTSPAKVDVAPMNWEGRLRGDKGAGTFVRQDGKCRGTFTARRG
jgi:hypothetical protein